MLPPLRLFLIALHDSRKEEPLELLRLGTGLTRLLPGLRNSLLILTVVLLAAGIPRPASAALTISITNLSLMPGQSGTLDVMIEGAGESISQAGFEFQIVPAASTLSRLRFLEEDEEYLAEPVYLFSGNSAATDDGIPSLVGGVSTTTLSDDTFIGGDGTADFADLTVQGDKLLARLRVVHDFGGADPETTVGDEFTVALVPSAGDSTGFAAGTSNTGFLDSLFVAAAPFASTARTVTVFSGIIIPGDMDWDVDVDFDDIDDFVLALSNSDAYQEAFGFPRELKGDLDGDGDHDFDDIVGFVVKLVGGASGGQAQHVPEPPTAVLALLALIGTAWRYRGFTTPRVSVHGSGERPTWSHHDP